MHPIENRCKIGAIVVITVVIVPLLFWCLAKITNPPIPYSSLINVVAFSPDGQKVLTGSYDHTARLWSADSGKGIGKPMRHSDWVLAAGRVLELGTGTGLATAWLLDGMDRASRLTSIESDAAVLTIAREALGVDERVTFVQADGGAWLGQAEAAQFDLIFADAWPGKYSHLDDALRALKRGGLYVIDDLLPQPNWPAGHESNVAELIATLEQRTDLRLTKLNCSTGIIIAAKVEEE